MPFRFNPFTGSLDVVDGSFSGDFENFGGDNNFTGVNQFDQGIFIPDSDGAIWRATVNTDGSWQTDMVFFGGEATLFGGFLTEDDLSFLVDENELNYLSQEI